MTSQAASRTYRPEIDGLRAVAVAAVIVNHISKEWLPNGYLGVDIFFVISGYVITASLSRHRHENFATFIGQFYARRIKRLLPALVLFVLITSLLISLFVPDPNLFLQTGLRSLLGASNLYLLEQSADYFAPAAELNPFTHTWSLAVEEQFYLIFPLLLWFSGYLTGTSKGARWLALWIMALTMGSLAGFLILYPLQQSAAYFLMPTRFWEMSAGCLVFLGTDRRAGLKRSLEKLPSLGLLAATIGVMVLPRELGMQATVAIVVLSACLIASLRPGTVAQHLMSSRPLVGLGLISYSLYLWHWGVLSLSRLTIGIHAWSLPFQLLLMLAMATLSYHYVERPLRRRPWFNGQVPILACGGAMVVGSSLLIIDLNEASSRFFLGDASISQQENAGEMEGRSCRAKTRFPACIVRPEDKQRGLKETRKRILILGDSHALHHVALAKQISARLGVEVAIYAKPGYPFPANPMIRRSAPDEAEKGLKAQQDAQGRIHSYLRQGDLLLIVNAGSYTADSHSNRKQGGHPAFRFPVQAWQGDDQSAFLDRLGKGLKRLSADLRPRGIKVVYFLPNPIFQETEFSRCNPQWFQTLNTDPACHDSVSLNKMNARHEQTLFRVLEENELGLKRKGNPLFFDPKITLCSASTCQRMIKGQQAYTDGSHLSAYGSELVADGLARFLKQAGLL